MDCNRARELTLDFLRGTLPAGPAEEMRAHLAGCAACRAHLEAERALGEVLAAKLPRHEAPPALRRRLAADWPGAARARPVGRVRGFAVAATLAVVLAAAVGGTTAVVVEGRAQTRAVATEALNDHLRVLEGAPLAEVRGGLHEVKPWFGGRLDFAPALAFAGNADFPLQGGAVEPFLDRRAAIFVFKRRLHTATLFVVMADGLAFPRHLTTRTVRGFNLFLWRAGEQGYVLASDLSLPELGTLQKLIAAP
ncbi:MAG TPA: zf-HC2 domain-containing protein [Polyangia bacterium]|nr:zf-HC2 domain-containing protein [Polyangia bacterium]